MEEEFHDVTALQFGDTWEDALTRCVNKGITITKCLLNAGDINAPLQVTCCSTQARVQLRPGESVVVTKLEEGAQCEDLEFVILEVDVQDCSLVIGLKVVDDGSDSVEKYELIKSLLCGDDRWRINRSSEKNLLRVLVKGLESLNVKPLSQEQKTKFDEVIESENLDKSQVRAIETALSSHLSVIQGPPGTGKTKT